MGDLRIDYVPKDDYSNGKLLRILMNINKNSCSTKQLGLRDYGYQHTIYVARQDDKDVGMVAYHKETVQLPEEPPKDVIVIDTLCAINDAVSEALLAKVPVLSYPTGRSPTGLPAGFTTPYNYEAEGDPKGLLLPASAKHNNNNKNYNNDNYYNNNSNSYNGNYTKPKKTLRTTNLSRKNVGSSAFFPKIQVKTGGSRRHRRSKTLRRFRQKSRK